MSDIKYVYNGGLAFSEEKDMKRLSQYAKEGWILEGFARLGFYYKLKKGKPQHVEYSLDYQTNADEDYFSLFEASGWEHVCSVSNHLHIFRAPDGTKPIYTDNTTLLEKYENEASRMGKYALYSLFLNIICWIIVGWSVAYLPTTLNYLTPIVVIIALPLIFTGLPYLGYLRKKNEIRRLLK